MIDAIHVVPVRCETQDQAYLAASMALDDVVAWFVENGHPESDIIERAQDAFVQARDELAEP